MQTTFALKDLGNLNYILGVEVTKAFDGVHLHKPNTLMIFWPKMAWKNAVQYLHVCPLGIVSQRIQGMLLKIHLNTGVL